MTNLAPRWNRRRLPRFCAQESYAAEFQGIVAVLGPRACSAIVACATEELEIPESEAPWARDACNGFAAQVESALVVL